ncbi:uncharacterized protein LOC123884937 [Trifolium pratense]|uniref:Uncharacterized protein n=1 Tax=Trifolium pratense TaxID=57577 RepID=A0ACB0L0P4_TRIPR|nr:uncharacterized protein LOC123884937 [Trifolium pratense]CAJ2662097.1 unnamed protein product [Trifolium pratense]
MFNIWRHKTLLNPITLSLSLNPNPFFHHYPLPFCTNTSDSTSFAVSYLINNFGFSPKSASKLCSTYNVHFKNAQKPDSVLNFFRNHGFSDTQLRDIIAKSPRLLYCNPSKRVLPKFQFLLSKGASNSDIVNLVSKYPVVLSTSLENRLVPAYELVYRFLKSHKDTYDLLNYNVNFFRRSGVQHNVRVLIENGVSDSNIAMILRSRSQTIENPDMVKLVKELKDLGFNPSKIPFGIALVAKTTVRKTLWKKKVDAFKKWGWSDEDVLRAFRLQPYCMLTSIDKIILLMSFWVNQLGWDARALANEPPLFLLSLEKRIIPRAQVVQFLLKKNLLQRKNLSLTRPFIGPDKLFHDKFIKRFKEDSSYLLKLYEEKRNLAFTKDKTCM